MDDIGDHLCEVVQEEMSKGLRPRLRLQDTLGSVLRRIATARLI